MDFYLTILYGPKTYPLQVHIIIPLEFISSIEIITWSIHITFLPLKWANNVESFLENIPNVAIGAGVADAMLLASGQVKSEIIEKNDLAKKHICILLNSRLSRGCINAPPPL